MKICRADNSTATCDTEGQVDYILSKDDEYAYPTYGTNGETKIRLTNVPYAEEVALALR